MNKNLIFVVAYNHEKFIEKVVARIPRTVLEDPGNELLIIDDGSSDNTFLVGERIRQQLSPQARVVILKNPVNQGYGGNQKLGYRYAIDAGFERVFLVHGDGQYAPELLQDLIAEYEKPSAPDAVFGTRIHGWKGALAGGMPFYKLVGNRILTFLQNRILRSSMSEFHSGYRTYQTALLKKIPFERNSNDFHFDTEIIIQTLAAGARIVEIPIPTYYGDEICHVNGFKYARDVMLASLHFRLQRMGFLYDPKFDVVPPQRSPNPSPYSAQTLALTRIANDTKVLLLGSDDALESLLLDKGCTVHALDFDMNTERRRLADWLSTRDYDYLVLGDIIERLVDPEDFLDQIRNSLSGRRNTRLLVCTGNVAFFVVRFMLFCGQFNYGLGGILDRLHTRLYTRASVRRIFEQAGYRILLRDNIPLPFSSIFPESPRLGVWLEKFNRVLAKIRHGLFAYQLFYEVEPLPTTRHLLKQTNEHSISLRSKTRPIEIQNDLYL